MPIALAVIDAAPETVALIRPAGVDLAVAIASAATAAD
jgi:hypothetical protein